jgi:RNA polymerase sigma-70 factor (ECF subfamily)
MEYSDHDLVKLAQNGDKQAFGALYDIYYNKIIRFTFHRTGSVQIAADITSETFLKILKNINKFVFQDIPFSAWVYRIASNETANYFRQKKSYSLNKMIELGFEPEDAKNLEDEFVLEQEKIDKNNAFIKAVGKIKSLPIHYQEVISLRFFEKKKTREIADILGKNEGTIKSLLSRGLDKLRNEMEVKNT